MKIKLSIVMIFCFLNLFSQTKETKLNWLTDAQEAVALSNKQQKPILLFFTGSDWCGWCIKLQKEVFTQPEFIEWASKNVVLLELDFPRKTVQDEKIKLQNQYLQQVFGVRGYPTVFLATATVADGKVGFTALGQTGYVAGGAAAWLNVVKPFIK